MEGTPVINKRIRHFPLKVALADGREVLSTHKCDVIIVGLPTVLTRQIIQELSIVSLFGIRVLTEAGCKVRFNKFKCTVWYHNKIILEGGKVKTTDLWTLPICTPSTSTNHNPVAIPLVAPMIPHTHAHFATTQIPFFPHTV
jgi:hypothetical protein